MNAVSSVSGSVASRVFLFALWAATFAVAGNPESFTHVFEADDTVTITGYTGSGGNVVIPAVIDGRVVAAIGSWAFSGNANFTDITIPDSVIRIGPGAFSGCSVLTNIYIGAGVVDIGQNAFGWCENLVAITVDDDNSAFSSLVGVLFDKDRTLLIQYPRNKTGSYAIPEGVTAIGDSAFYGCRNLDAVTMPASLVTIGNYAFMYGGHFTEIALPVGVTSIGIAAFAACSDLAVITVDPLNAAYSSLDGVLFNKAQTELIQCPRMKSGDYAIPNGVSRIGDNAFQSCGLSSITIPDSVTTIGDEAFANCFRITEIVIPVGVEVIGVAPFSACFAMTAITVASANPAYSSREGVLFNKNQSALIQCPAGKTGDFTAPSGTSRIEEQAFAHSRLTRVFLPDSIDYIDWGAFGWSDSLTGVYFEGNAPDHEWGAFQGSGNLVVYYLPGTTGWGATYDGRPTALWDDGRVALPTFDPDGGAHPGGSVDVTVSCATDGATIRYTIDDSEPTESSHMVTSGGAVTVPIPGTLKARAWKDGMDPSATKTADYHEPGSDPANFSYTIEDDDTVTITGYSGIGGNVTIPRTIEGLPVVRIANFAFAYKDSLTGIAFPDSIAGIGNYAFADCNNLTVITFGNGLETIGESAFAQGIELTEVTIPDSVVNLGRWAFSSCSNLTAVTIGNGVTNIGYGAFMDCAGLERVAIPDSVVSVGDYVLTRCSSLVEAVIGSGLTGIGYGMFRDCTALTSVTIGTGVDRIGPYAFDGCSSLTAFDIPDNVVDIGGSAFNGCSALTAVTIGNGVTNIGASAFAWCENLAGVYFRGDAPAHEWGVFDFSDDVIVYYLPGTTGWGTTYAGRPTALWTIVATPTFDPDGGVLSGSSVNVVVSCATAGATIRYTTDGSEPTESSPEIASGGSVTVPVPGTLKAKAWKTGMDPSATKTADYTAETVNGIPIAWLETHRLPTDGSANDMPSPDGSGFTVWQQWRAGTNPRDPTDVLRMTEPPAGVPQGFRLRWRSVATRTYRVERGANLAGTPPFTVLEIGIQGEDGVTEYIDITGAGSAFYRVAVE